MAKDARQKALMDVQRAQATLEGKKTELEKAKGVRLESFKRARAAGLSLAEIGNAAKLHRSRVDQILRGK